MLTLQQLLALTPREVRQRAKNPTLSVKRDKEERKYGKEARSVFLNCRLYHAESTGTNYNLIIRNYGMSNSPKKFLFKPSSQLWVHCSCPYFTYHLEVALTLKKSSSIYDSNGNLPRITNPRLRPYVCKHLFATLISYLNADKGK